MNQNMVIAALAALAHPIRLAAFRALVVAGPQGLAQKVLAEQVGVGPTNLAFHLKELAAAGLVTPSPVGRFVLYRAEFERMNGLLSYLSENCCQGAVCAVDAPSACPC